MTFFKATIHKAIFQSPFRRMMLWAMLFFSAGLFSMGTSADNSKGAAQLSAAETQLTAVFIYQFSQFIKWPPAIDENHSYPSFTICVDQNLRLQVVLERITANESANDRPITVRTLSDISDTKQCQMIYLSSFSKHNLDLLSKLGSHATLTITRNEELLNRGTMIRLKKEGKRIRPQINIGMIEKTEISISSKLLRISEVISDE